MLYLLLLSETLSMPVTRSRYVFQADIDGAQLSIALEPEAASLYCQLLPTDKVHSTNGTNFAAASAGSKYMVIDLGGT